MVRDRDARSAASVVIYASLVTLPYAHPLVLMYRPAIYLLVTAACWPWMLSDGMLAHRAGNKYNSTSNLES